MDGYEGDGSVASMEVASTGARSLPRREPFDRAVLMEGTSVRVSRSTAGVVWQWWDGNVLIDTWTPWGEDGNRPPSWVPFGKRAESVRAVLIRPWLWRSVLRFVPNKPWRVSSWRQLRSFIEFRMETAYGDKSATPPANDTVAFLTWCRRFPR